MGMMNLDGSGKCTWVVRVGKLCFTLVAVILVTNVKGDHEEPRISLPTCCDLDMLGDGQRTCTLQSGSRMSPWEVPAVHTTHNVTTQYKLVRQPLVCQSEDAEDYQVIPFTTFPNKPRFQLKPEGILMLGDRMFATYFRTTQYCIHGITDTELHVKTCKATCSKQQPCIRKCCQDDLVYDAARKRCWPAGEQKWTPKLFAKPSKPESLISQTDLEQKDVEPLLLVRSPPSWMDNCPNRQYMLFPYSKTVVQALTALDPDSSHEALKFRLGEDGKLRLRNINRKWTKVPDSSYCTDGIRGFHDPPQPFNNSLEETFVFVCVPEQETEAQVSEYYGWLALCTSVFALITVIVYFLLFSKQNIHGWTTMAHSASVFCFFVFIATAHLTKHNLELHDSHACRFIATMAHYFFLSTFCWLLMISFDLWSTFRSISAASAKVGVGRFVMYSLFAWGVPLLIVIMSWILDLVYRDDENTEVKVPMYGVSFCYITRYALWEFVYGPVAILLLLNVLCFTMTAVKLYQYQQSTKMATKNMKKDRQSFMLFLKLFFVVGALWVFEVVSFSIHGAHITWYWQIFDTLNVLQPIAIFIIFVFKREVINPLHDKYPVLRPLIYPMRKALLCCQSKKGHHGVTSQSESAGLTSKDKNTRISRVTSLVEGDTGV